MTRARGPNNHSEGGYAACKNPRHKYPISRIDGNGQVVIQDRQPEEVRAQCVAMHEKGISPLRIAVKLEVPLNRVLMLLSRAGRDVSEFNLRGVEAYPVHL